MEREKLELQVLLEIALQQSYEGTSEEIIRKMLPLYMRKLNCFLAGVINSKIKSIVIPKAIEAEEFWLDVHSKIQKEIDDNSQNIVELFFEDKVVYAYPLYNFGWFVLAKKTAFDENFKFELKSLINQLGRSLCQATEEERLKLFQNLVNSSSDALQVSTEDGSLYYINETSALRLGINQKDISKYKVQDFEQKFKDNKEWENHIKELRTVDYLTIEGVNINQSTGEKFDVEVTVKLIEINGKSFIFAISRDVTVRKKAEIELANAKNLAEHAAKAKELFLANMSHEIRTPLNVVIGMIRLMLKEDLTIDQTYYVNQAGSAAKHLLTILNNILDMSKIESGELQLDEKDFSLSVMLYNVHSILYSQAQEKGIDFRLYVASDIAPALVGDDIRLRQVLINLLGNSIKFTEKGHVSLSVELIKTTDTSQTVKIIVEDTGIGMSDDFIANIFDKFSQEQNASNRKFEGTGLGMAISRDLVLLMNSDLKVDSHKGKGTTISFELELPIGNKDKLIDTSHFVKPNVLEGFRILIAEDNPMNRFIASRSVEYLGCTYSEAENGLEAIEKVKNEHFDLILMDIQMPEMDGLEATKYIVKNIDDQIPIIALTANAFKHDIDVYLANGMIDFITKPYDEQEFFRKLEYHLRKKNHNLEYDISYLPVEEQIQEKLLEASEYDLTEIRKISNDDNDIIKIMLNLFVNLVNENSKLIEEALEVNDVEKIRKIAHKIKPSIDQLGINSLKEKILKLEHVDTNIDTPSLKSLVSEIDVILKNTVEQIKNKEINQ